LAHIFIAKMHISDLYVALADTFQQVLAAG